MKWFKHMSASWDDEKLARFVGEGGKRSLARYGFYMRLCEIVAEAGGCVVLTYTEWGARFGLKPEIAAFTITEAAACGLVVTRGVAMNVLSVSIPSLEVHDDGPRLPWSIWKCIRARIFKRDDYTCQYCGVRIPNPDCDHVVPVSRGGSHDDDNLVTACVHCNRSKGSKMPEAAGA